MGRSGQSPPAPEASWKLRRTAQATWQMPKGHALSVPHLGPPAVVCQLWSAAVVSLENLSKGRTRDGLIHLLILPQRG